MTTITAQSPKQIDARLAELYTAAAKVAQRIDSELRSIHAAAGDRRDRSNRYKLTEAEAVATVEAKGFAWETVAIDRLAEQRAKLVELVGEQNALNAEFRRRGGWSRFFIVQNAGGHIHSSMHCSTCRLTTQFGWLPELSDESEADAVAAHGALLCTVCYPSAPVEWTNKYELEAAAKAASQCAGAGRYVNRELPNRTGYYSGNYGTCETCGDIVTLTKSNKLRAHKSK